MTATPFPLQIASTITAHTCEGVIIADRNRTIIDANTAYCEIVGHERSDILGKTLNQVTPLRNYLDSDSEIWQQVELEGSWLGKVSGSRHSGDTFAALLNVDTIRDASGSVTNYIAVIRDITQTHFSYREFNTSAHYDHLTSLPNRHRFNELVEQQILFSETNESHFAVLLIDIDLFKKINDSHGHEVGDILLMEISSRIRGCIRENDVVARQGGDEFLVMLSEITSPSEVDIVAQRIIDNISEPMRYRDSVLQVNASIGISLYPDDANSLESLIIHADIAMYHAKEFARGKYIFFKEEIKRRNEERANIESRLRSAISGTGLSLAYQPQLTPSGNVKGFEVLIRWNDTELGFVPPDRFIPIAEESDLICDLGMWIINQVSHDIGVLVSDGYDDLTISINLSARQLTHHTLLPSIHTMICEQNIPASMVEFEVTESAFIHDIALAKLILQYIKDSGVSLSLDDFGTGYSSLSYLNELPFDKIKIDKTFVQKLPHDSTSTSIVNAIIGLARGLSMSVVAEGVEELEQLESLQASGCDLIQGFYFSKPLPFNQAREFLMDNRPGLCLLRGTC
ncbi:MAG: EAL domain-containing protein [Chromatiales bacterium]|nr:EAL domain-containing protein [Chromatiales bacterium]